MISHLKAELQRADDFTVPADNVDNPSAIEKRCCEQPYQLAKPLRRFLSYLYLTNGPVTMSTKIYRDAEPGLTEYEKILGRYFKSRTNGTGRRSYGIGSLRAAQRSRFRCEVCTASDVRVLVIDHTNGREDTTSFQMLCANCHQIKSRLFDWTGEKRRKTTESSDAPNDGTATPVDDLDASGGGRHR